MYSTKLASNRYIATCISVINNIKKIRFIIDTGAMYTCCSSKYIYTDLIEDDVKDCEFRYIGGFNNEDKKNPIKIYKYHLAQFTIGNVDLGTRDIWITFDERVDDNVLGMDILRHATFLQLADSNNIIFFKDKRELMCYLLKEDSADIAAAFKDYTDNRC